MDGNNGETVDLSQLALEFLQGTRPTTPEETSETEDSDTPEVEEVTTHPAWKSILDAVPAEYHDALKPTLQEWDTGVSKRFQKLHDEYEPLKRFENYEPDTVEEAVKIYQQLIEDPAATWETIGRVFGLSPEELAQSGSSEDEDFDDYELPDALKKKLARIDDYGKVLDSVTSDLAERRRMEEESEEDAALEEYLGELEEEYGEFDADYVVSLLAVGIDGDEAIERYRAIAGHRNTEPAATPPEPQRQLPKVMSNAGGQPQASSGVPNLTKLDNQNTKELVAEILRQANANS